jgi:hypothetical protein
MVCCPFDEGARKDRNKPAALRGIRNLGLVDRKWTGNLPVDNQLETAAHSL